MSARWRPAALALLLIAAVAALWLLSRALVPPPPTSIVLAAGPRGGAYHAFAERYAAALAAEGVGVDVLATDGSVANLALLATDRADVAFVQGGTADDSQGLSSLGSVFLEPLWVFHRAEHDPGDLRGVAGLRIAVGPEGSGTRALALELLARNGVVAEPVDLGGEAAADALIAGRVDAMVLVSAVSPLVERLLAAPGVELLPFRRAEAYGRQYAWLQAIVVPEGALDLARGTPAQDLPLVAVAASLVARDDLHPAVVGLLLRVAQEVHGSGTLLAPAGRFPSPEHVAIPLSEDARRYHTDGPSFLYRWLPIATAAWVNRLLVFAVPLVTLLLPLSRVAPPLYQWRVRSRIYRWYGLLREIEARAGGAGPEHLPGVVDELRRLDEELVAEVFVPLAYMEEFYRLRTHIEHVREQVRRRLEAGAQG